MQTASRQQDVGANESVLRRCGYVAARGGTDRGACVQSVNISVRANISSDAAPIDTSFPGFAGLMAGLGARIEPDTGAA